MTIKEFVEKYNAISTDRLKEDYLNEYEIDDNKNELQNTLNLICKLI